jgi:Ca-activated chloride channel family protein
VKTCAVGGRRRGEGGYLVAVFVALLLPAPARAGDIAVRITSPLGRTGTPGTVRIVAQVKPPKGKAVSEVRFSVDGKPQGTVTAGPPYSVEWTDSNPFERRTIVAEAQGTDGESGRDEVVLEPYELNEVTEVTSVLVDASVYDKTGRPVKGMTAPDFVLEEDGKTQKPDMVAQETIPTTFAVLVDSSHSMWRNLDFVQAAAGRLAGYLRPRDRVIVAPFSLGLKAVTGPTNDRQTIAEAVQAITAEGGTALRDSMIELAGRLSNTPGRRVMILITDGYDENSKASLADAVAAAKLQGITVYCVGIGGVAGISINGHDELKGIATATGGRWFFPLRPDELPDVYDELAADAQLRYLISYTPTNQRRDGTWRNISLTTHAEDMTVKARPGYFAPTPPPVRAALEFTAMDPQSRFLEVTRDDLIVLEDGVEQKIETFQEATTPVTIVLALDQSGSMQKSADKVVEAATGFVQALRPEDWLGVITFADKSLVAHGMTQEREATLQAIAAYKAIGGTALYDALCDSVLMLKQYKGRRAIVVLTDGRDENNPGTAPGSIRTWEQVVGLVRETEVTVFAVGLGTKIDPDRLSALATVSGGEAFFPQEVSALSAQYDRVIDNLGHRYIIGYTSTNSARDGKWRKVEIKTRSAGIVVHSRQGYFAPDK